MTEIKLLHIEDDAEDARLVARMLKKSHPSNLRIDWVESIEKAATLSEKTQYDAVLIDFYIGRKTAIHFLGKLPLSLDRAAIVLLTGKDAEVVEEASFNLGVDFYVSKDGLNATSLQRAVRYAIRNKQQQNRIRDFSQVLAHDLVNPVGQIMQSLNLVRDSLFVKEIEPALETLEIADNACNRVAGILNDLRDYSLSQSGEIVTQQVSVTRLVDSVLDSLETYIKERNATVEREQLGSLELDRRIFTHVVQNLIQNGIKYNRSEEPRVVISRELLNKEVVLKFSDNGIGIPESERERVFHPFARIDHSEEFRGSGLGLSMCREFVERHEGSIWISEEPSSLGGTTICVKLPQPKA